MIETDARMAPTDPDCDEAHDRDVASRWTEGRHDETDHAAAHPGIARVVRLWDDSWTGRSLRANADPRRARNAGLADVGPQELV